MLKKYAAVCLFACLLAVVPAMILAQDARTTLEAVAKAMGADNLRTIQFSGTGSNSGIGQNVNPRAAWPVVRVKEYRREMDFSATASLVQLVRVQGGADQGQTEYISPDAPWDTQFRFWLTPFGFIKGAQTNNGTVKSETIEGARYDVVTFTLQNKYRVVGYINDQKLIERVQTWVDNDVLGDMLVDASYSAYKDFGSVKFPTMIVEKQAGFPVLILSVSDVKPNVAVNIQRPATPAAAGVQPVSVQTEKVADGVFYLKGGTHHSVAVEFVDHVAVIEGPLNEQRSLAVIAEVKKLIPNKPIRYLVNTHHHFDHSGGLRTYVDEGATIVTQDINKQFYVKAFAAPRTLNPDRLASSQKKANIEVVTDKKTLSDGNRMLELYLIKDNPHNSGILMAFLPKEKILIEVDVYTPANPAPANAAARGPATVNSSTTNLVDNVEKLKLDFEKILPLHGAGAVTRADLYAAIGKPAPDIATIMAVKTPVAAPPSPGKDLLDIMCTTCHNLNRVQTKRLNLADWQTIVERMKGKGLELSDDATSTLVDYLVKTYGPDK